MGQGSAKNVVEINGHLYDAHTGLPVAKKQVPQRKAPKLVDGFAKVKPTSLNSRRKKAQAAQAVHTTTKKTQTLHRGAMTKPKTQTTSLKSHKIQRKPATTPHHRAARAQSSAKSQSISKFHKSANDHTPSHHAPVSKAPVFTRESSPTPSASHALIERAMTGAPTKHKSVKKSINQRAKDTLKRRPKLLSVASSALVMLLVAGYVTYLNIPNIALKVAAREAGFEANMPGYQPNGYKLGGPISYEQGQITIQFDSKNDDRSYEITQRQTNWDSHSLLDNYVVSNADLYQTYQERGLTIYVYDGSDATWVNGGIWYSIEGDSRLNAEQLIKIASSL